MKHVLNREQMTTLEKKIEHFSRILTQKPGDELTILALAEASFRRGLKLEALTAYQEVGGGRPVPEAHLAVAEIYSAQGMSAEAYGELRRLFQLDPENVEARLLVNTLQEDALPPDDVRAIMEQPTSEEAFDEARLRLKIQRTIYNRELQERTRNVTLEPGTVIHEYYMEEAKKKLIRVDELLRELERFREHNQKLSLSPPRPEPVSAAGMDAEGYAPPLEIPVVAADEDQPAPVLDELPVDMMEDHSSHDPEASASHDAGLHLRPEEPSAGLALGTDSTPEPVSGLSLAAAAQPSEAPAYAPPDLVVPETEPLHASVAPEPVATLPMTPEPMASLPVTPEPIASEPPTDAVTSQPVAASSPEPMSPPEEQAPPLLALTVEAEPAPSEPEPSMSLSAPEPIIMSPEPEAALPPATPPQPEPVAPLPESAPPHSEPMTPAPAPVASPDPVAEAPADVPPDLSPEPSVEAPPSVETEPSVPSAEREPAPHLDLDMMPRPMTPDPVPAPSFEPAFDLSMDDVMAPDLPDIGVDDLPSFEEGPPSMGQTPAITMDSSEPLPVAPPAEDPAPAPAPPVAPPTFADAPPVPEPAAPIAAVTVMPMVDDSTMILTAPEPELPPPPVAPPPPPPEPTVEAPSYSSGEVEAPRGLSPGRKSFYETHAEALSGLTTTLARTRGVTSIYLVAREGVTIDSVAKDEISEKRVGELVRESFEFLEAFANDPAYWVLECAGGIFVMQKLDDRHVLIAIGQAGANFGALRYTMDKTRTKFEQLLAQAPE